MSAAALDLDVLEAAVQVHGGRVMRVGQYKYEVERLRKVCEPGTYQFQDTLGFWIACESKAVQYPNTGSLDLTELNQLLRGGDGRPATDQTVNTYVDRLVKAQVAIVSPERRRKDRVILFCTLPKRCERDGISLEARHAVTRDRINEGKRRRYAEAKRARQQAPSVNRFRFGDSQNAPTGPREPENATIEFFGLLTKHSKAPPEGGAEASPAGSPEPASEAKPGDPNISEQEASATSSPPDQDLSQAGQIQSAAPHEEVIVEAFGQAELNGPVDPEPGYEDFVDQDFDPSQGIARYPRPQGRPISEPELASINAALDLELRWRCIVWLKAPFNVVHAVARAVKRAQERRLEEGYAEPFRCVERVIWHSVKQHMGGHWGERGCEIR